MNWRDDYDYNQSFSTDTWSRFFKLAKPLKKHFIWLFVVMAWVAVFDNISPLMTRYAIDHFIAKGTKEGLVVYGILFLFVVLMQGIGTKFFLKVAGGIEVEVGHQIREEGFKKLQELSFSYYDRTPVGWIISRLIADTSRLAEVVAWSLVDIFWGGASIIAIMIMLFIMDWHLAILSLLIIPVLFVVSTLFQRILLKVQREIRRENSKLTGEFNEGIMGARTTKTLHRERKNTEEFEETATKLYTHSVRAGKLSAIFLPIISLLGAVAAAVVLTVGGQRMEQGLMQIGTLYAFFIYTMRLWEPIRHVARVFRDLQSAQAAAERVMHLLSEESDLVDRPEVIERYGEKDGEGEMPWPEIEGRISFKDVSFWYKENEIVLDQFNLDIEPGQTIALVGETGAGKSTIINLLCRFYEPSRGQILIDGVDYRERPLPWLHEHLGYVLQTPHLFSGTIADNIRFGRLEATDEEIVNAAKLVSAHEFIMRHERGYDTEVGEGGGRLSTGEKQLISFARAVIADPAFFLLDEATASIDTETEHAVQQAIETIRQGRTMIVVAHRLSTIRNADRILVIEDGKVIESGTHEALLEAGGQYAQLYRMQFMQESYDELNRETGGHRE